MNRSQCILGILGGAVLMSALGCGPRPAEQSALDKLLETPSDPVDVSVQGGSTVEVEGLLGTVPQDKLERVFNTNQEALISCYEDVVDEWDVIEGELILAMQIDVTGRAIEVFIRNGNLGSLTAESCVLKRVKRMQFPKPGGGIAHVTYPLAFVAPYDPPEPEEWNSARVAPVVEANAASVTTCRSGGQSGIEITAYIDSSGRVFSAGAAAQSFDAFDAAQCLAQAVRQWQFPQPAGEAAKVQVAF